MAQFYHNFDSDPVGAFPAGFTPLFGDSQSDWGVVENASIGSGHFLTNTGGGSGRRAIGWKQATEMEVVAAYYRKRGAEIISGPAVRLDTAGGQSGYTSWLRSSDATGLVKHQAGVETKLSSWRLRDNQSYVIVRLRISGDTLKERIHPVTTVGLDARPTNNDFVIGDHVFTDNMAVNVTADVMPGNLSTAATYYIRVIDDNQVALQASAPVGGSSLDVDITSDGGDIVFHLQDEETQRTDWNFNVVDADIAGNGYGGLFDIFGNAYYKWIGIGTGGATAPSGPVRSGLTAAGSITDNPASLSSQPALRVSGAGGLADQQNAPSAAGKLAIGLGSAILGNPGQAAAGAALRLSAGHTLIDTPGDTGAKAKIYIGAAGRIIARETTAAPAGILFLSEQAALHGRSEAVSLAGTFSELIRAAIGLGGKPAEVASHARLPIRGSNELFDNPASVDIGGDMLLSMEAAMNGRQAHVDGVVTMLIQLAIDIARRGEAVRISGSLTDGQTARIGFTDRGTAVLTKANINISGKFKAGENPENISLDPALMVAIRAGLAENPASADSLSKLLLSLVSSVADNPESVSLQQVAVSPRVRIAVTGHRVGNTIILSGQRSQRLPLTAAKVARTLTIEG